MSDRELELRDDFPDDGPSGPLPVPPAEGPGAGGDDDHRMPPPAPPDYPADTDREMPSTSLEGEDDGDEDP